MKKTLDVRRWMGVFSNCGGVCMGDPRFAPLLATLDELGVLVFPHPLTPSAVPTIRC